MSLTIINKLNQPKKIPINHVIIGDLFLIDSTPSTKILCIMSDKSFEYIDLTTGYVLDYEHYTDTLVELVNVTITIDSYKE
jgi:hypothetical protein